MASIRKTVERMSYLFSWVAGAGLTAMVVLTCADVVGRAFGYPVPGTFEIVGFLGVIVGGFAIAYTQLLGGHIAIDYLLVYLPRPAGAFVRSLISLTGAWLFALVFWQSYLYAADLARSGEVSPTQKFPFYPFAYALALACVPMCLLLVLDFCKWLREAVRK